MVTESHRAGEVVRRIRQLARKGAPREDPVDLNDVVRDVVPLVRTELHHHEVSLVVDVASKLSPVRGDRVQLQRVVLNLVMNAIEAMGSVTDRPRELVIRSERHDADHLRVAVQDTGAGVAQDHLDEVFSAFFTTKPGAVWAWVCRLAAQSWRRTAAGSGPPPTSRMGLSSTFRCRPTRRVRRCGDHSKTAPIPTRLR
jgi:signal transduction histidine kinase